MTGNLPELNAGDLEPRLANSDILSGTETAEMDIPPRDPDYDIYGSRESRYLPKVRSPERQHVRTGDDLRPITTGYRFHHN